MAKKKSGFFAFLKRRKKGASKKGRAAATAVTRAEFNALKGRVGTLETKVARIDRHLASAGSRLRAA